MPSHPAAPGASQSSAPARSQPTSFVAAPKLQPERSAAVERASQGVASASTLGDADAEDAASDALPEEHPAATSEAAATPTGPGATPRTPPMGGSPNGGAGIVGHAHAASATSANAGSGLSPRHQLESWLAEMVKCSASDLILRAGGRPSCRVDGRILFLPGRVPHAGALAEVLEGIVGATRMANWREGGSCDVALQLDGLGRFRLNAYKQMGEPALVLRRVSDKPPRLENLCLPTGELQKIGAKKRGIVLVTGIAGSGKSTTLAGMIQYMNQHTERHVITLEDPVELIFTEDRCVISQREVGTDVPTFSAGLRHALRQSPDVILIGEMRDGETVQAALDATETGHLVMSTLHTVNAAQSVERIISFFPNEQHQQVRDRLADNLVAVLSQRLLPRRSGHGMVPALELMVSTPRVRELLSEGRTNELGRAIEQGGDTGLISFNQSLRQLVEAGLIELEVALAASDRPDELMLALRGFTSGGDRQKQHLRLNPTVE
ncbi:MAG: PilT/PilU family type 4a pilus ATPase [Planctomycetaceae bacterium]|nr:PilT/PilU family type 4a pilus ATPase [Planctomycetaceae bacterium]